MSSCGLNEHFHQEAKESIKRFFSPTKLGEAENKKVDDGKTLNNNQIVRNKRKLCFDDERQQKTQKLDCKPRPCPKDIDEDVWNSIPIITQDEILREAGVSATPVRSHECPAGADPEVFSQLPPEIQQELKSHQVQVTRAKKTNTIKNYFSVK